MKPQKTIFCICAVLASLLMTFMSACFNQTTNSSSMKDSTTSASFESTGDLSNSSSFDSTEDSSNSSSEETPVHTHTYSNAWTYNETYHWHAATCEHSSEVINNELHMFDNGIQEEAGITYTCLVCGYQNLVVDSADDNIAEEVEIPVYNVKEECIYLHGTLNIIKCGYSYTDENGLCYSLNADAKSYTIANYVGKDKKVVIPSMFNGLPVKYIFGDYYLSDGPGKIGGAFFYNDTVEEVIIPDSVTNIGPAAFFACTNLKKISISENVSDFRTYVFYGCTSLSEFNIPNAVSYLSQNPFKTSLYVRKHPKNSAIYVDGWILGYRGQVENVVLENGFKGIVSSAFYTCESLRSVTLADDFVASEYPTTLGESAFMSCTNLITVELPDNITLITSSAFSHCVLLEKVKLPKNLTGVESQVFLNCTSLQNIQLPEGLERIGVKAFNNCPRLTNINIPDSVLWIGNNAFYESGCVVTDELGIEYVDDWIVGGGI